MRKFTFSLPSYHQLREPIKNKITCFRGKETLLRQELQVHNVNVFMGVCFDPCIILGENAARA